MVIIANPHLMRASWHTLGLMSSVVKLQAGKESNHEADCEDEAVFAGESVQLQQGWANGVWHQSADGLMMASSTATVAPSTVAVGVNPSLMWKG